jgi:hypothetical protein
VRTFSKREPGSVRGAGNIAVRSGALCVCGVRLTSTDDLADHHDWCLGNGRANAQLQQEVIQRHGALTYEALVAGAGRSAPRR